MNRVFPLVYLEGERIPVQSVVVTSKVGSLAQISIALFPSKYKIMPNTIVHVAYYTDDDPMPYVLGEGVVTGRASNRSKTTNNSDEINALDYVSLLVNIPTIFTPLQAKYFQSIWTESLTSLNAISDVQSFATYLSGLLSNNGSIDAAVKKIIAGAIGDENNSSFAMASQPFNLYDRIYSVDTSAVVKSMFSAASFQTFLDGNFGQSDMNLTLMSLLMAFFQSAGYQFVTLTVPSAIKTSSTETAIRQYVGVPQILYGPIPACNWLFSSFFNDFEYEIDYNQMPTRLVAPLTFMNTVETDVQAPPANGSTPSTSGTQGNDKKATTSEKVSPLHAEIAPAELRSIVGGKSFGYLTNKNCLTNEEQIRGIKVVIHPMDSYMGFVKATYIDKATGTTKTETNGSVIESFADLFFYSGRLAAVRTRMSTMPFNPYVVPGLPGGVFSVSDGFIGGGPIDSVTHTLRASGEATTEVDFGGFAEAEEYLNTNQYYYSFAINEGVLDTTQGPNNTPTNLTGTHAGEGSLTDVNVYQTAFGVKGYSPLNPQMQKYISLSLSDQYAMLKSSRPIVTLFQLLDYESIPSSTNPADSFYSASAYNTITPLYGGSWTTPVFNTNRHNAVLNYKQDIVGSGIKGVF